MYGNVRSAVCLWGGLNLRYGTAVIGIVASVGGGARASDPLHKNTYFLDQIVLLPLFDRRLYLP